MNVEQDIEMSTDEALISALTPKQVGDIELQPYSMCRQSVAMYLGPDNAPFIRAVMAVWVCTLSEREALASLDDIRQSQINAFKWAESLGCSVLHCEPILDIWRRLNRELTASTKARMRGGQDGDAPKNVGGQPLV